MLRNKYFFTFYFKCHLAPNGFQYCSRIMVKSLHHYLLNTKPNVKNHSAFEIFYQMIITYLGKTKCKKIISFHENFLSMESCLLTKVIYYWKLSIDKSFLLIKVKIVKEVYLVKFRPWRCLPLRPNSCGMDRTLSTWAG